MTIRHLKIFLTVCRTENITRAAEQLHMTQPAVTRAIHEMEDYYGVRLFERIGKHISITEDGRRLSGKARLLLDTWEDLEKSFLSADGTGILRIGATMTIGEDLPEYIRMFQKSHPGMKVHVRVAKDAFLEEALFQNELDLAMIEGNVIQKDLTAQEYSSDHMVLIAGNRDPILKKKKILLADLKDCDMLMREKGSAGRNYLDHLFALHEMQIQPVWESASTQALIHAAEMGLGIAILPEKLVQSAVDEHRVSSRKISDESLARTYYLVAHKDKFISAAMKDWMRICKENS